MKRYLFVAFVGLAFAGATASVLAGQQKNVQRRVIPILVHVNRQGQVTEANPAYHLRPSFQKLLRSTLDKMITKPAMDHGHPISSQFVINLAMELTPQPDGKYGVRFSYVSSKPLPSGQWNWARTSDHRLALQDASAANRMMPLMKPPANQHESPPPPPPPPSTGGGKGH